MSFVAKLRRARDVLRQEGRLSLRALARELEIDGDSLEEFVEELVDVQQVARRMGGALVWAGEPAPASPRGSPPPAREPRAYTPKHLAEKILASKSALEGERKQVTVLFAAASSARR